MAKRHGVAAYRLVWNDTNVVGEALRLATEAMADLMLRAEKEAKDSLRPGFGVDTGTMQDGIHVAEQGYNWQGDHHEPSENHPVRGGVRVMPTLQSGGRAHGAHVLELGSGQNYAIYFHQKHYPFLRVPWERAMGELKGEVEKRWRRFTKQKGLKDR